MSLLEVIRFKVVKTSVEKKCVSDSDSCLLMLCLLLEEYQKVSID